MNRTSDEIRRRRWNWTGHIMKKDKEKHCVIALEWRLGGKRRSGRPKTMCRRMVEDERTEQLGGSHGPMSDPRSKP